MHLTHTREQNVRTIILGEIRHARVIVPFLVGYIAMLTLGVILFVIVFTPFLLQNGKEPAASAEGLSRPEALALVVAVILQFMIILPAAAFGCLYSRHLFYRVLPRILEAVKCFEAPSDDPGQGARQTTDAPGSESGDTIRASR